MSDAAAAQATTTDNGHTTGYETKNYRTYILLVLMAVYTLNFIDRTLIAVVAPSIIETFGFTDGQWSWIYGPPFALFYAIMGLPIAMWADRANRVQIIAICIVIWSIMTALCGISAGFWTLLFFRVGVAIGEAGGTPPANSIIGDYFKPTSRATALGIYSMGVTLGSVLANLFGGPIAQMKGETFGAWISSIGLGGLFGSLDWSGVEGWRIAFFIIGLPGILLAFILLRTVKEPPRGYSDPPGSNKEHSDFKDAFREIISKPTFWWMAMGASLVAFVGYGLAGFQAPFLVRIHGLDVRQAAINYGAPLSALAALGTFAGGVLTERLSKRSPTAVAWVPAIGLLIATPFYILALMSDNLTLVFVFWGIAAITHYAYLGAQYNIATGVVSNRARATAVAVLLILVSIIGNGIGPLFVGFFSDVFTANTLSTLDPTGLLSVKSCAAGAIDEAGSQICTAARSQGLRNSLALTCCWFILAAFCFLMSARTLKRDFVTLQAA